MKIYVMTVEKQYALTDQDIDDIMCSALEGGITYWCSKCQVEGGYRGQWAHEQISRGGSLKLFDNEDGSEYILDLQKFLNGFKEAMNNGYKEDWMDRNGTLKEYLIDGVMADTIVQYALFGEVVFG